MTQPLNLIPSHRLAAGRRRVWRGRCVITCGAYACIVATLTFGARTVVSPKGDNLAGLLDSAALESERSEEMLKTVRADHESAEALLRSSRAIAAQPDWSLLFSLLARKGNSEVVLKGITVHPADLPKMPEIRPVPGKPAPKWAAPVDPGVVVAISGAAPTQAAASQYALRLESTGLFGQVALVDTVRETFGDLSLVSFRIECTLGGPKGEPANKSVPQRPINLRGDR